MVCSIKFFKIPSFNTTFWLPLEFKQVISERYIHKIKTIISLVYVKLNFRWGLFFTKSSKNEVKHLISMTMFSYVFRTLCSAVSITLWSVSQTSTKVCQLLLIGRKLNQTSPAKFDFWHSISSYCANQRWCKQFCL